MMNVGYTVTARPVGVDFQPFGERPELALRLISYARDDLYTIILLGRLYYRDEQAAKLRGKVDEQALALGLDEDAALALAICRAYGADALCGLEGDFALTCFDAKSNRLIAIRDAMGGYPIFWARQAETVSLSTSIRPLIDLAACVELDSEYAIDYLVIPDAGVAEMPGNRTAFRAIKRLPPGWLLDVDVSSGRAESRPHWDWREKIEAPRVKTIDEAGRLVRDRLEAAVRERLSRRYVTASTFSGGFDSTSIALLAEKHLAARGQRLHALSLVFKRSHTLAQERDYIESALARRGAIIHHYIEGDGILDYDDHERLPLSDEPFAMSSRFKFNEVLVLAAAAANADTVMGGEGGDQLFDLPVLFLLTDLLNKRDVGGALALARRYGRAQSEGPWRILWNAARLLLPLSARDGIRPLLADGRAPFENQSERTLPPWFTKDFARRNRLQAHALAFQPSRSESQLFNVRDIAFSVGEWYRWYIGSPHGINITHPFWDARIISLVLGLPKMLQAVPEQSKPVLAAAVSDLLPEKIIRRGRKSHFGELLGGYARHQEALERLILDSPVDTEMIDKTILLDCLRKASLGIFGQGVGAARLRITLSYLSWLSNMDRWMKARVPALPLPRLMTANRIEKAPRPA
jgi:asparagine synthase (glutamine-hydrolysing)